MANDAHLIAREAYWRFIADSRTPNAKATQDSAFATAVDAVMAYRDIELDQLRAQVAKGRELLDEALRLRRFGTQAGGDWRTFEVRCEKWLREPIGGGHD